MIMDHADASSTVRMATCQKVIVYHLDAGRMQPEDAVRGIGTPHPVRPTIPFPVPDMSHPLGFRQTRFAEPERHLHRLPFDGGSENE